MKKRSSSCKLLSPRSRSFKTKSKENNDSKEPLQPVNTLINCKPRKVVKRLQIDPNPSLRLR